MRARTAAALLAAAAITGCGATKTITRTVTTRQTVTVTQTISQSTSTSANFLAPPKRGGSQCTIGVPGHDVLATFGSTRFDVTPACNDTIQQQADGGTLWQLTNVRPTTALSEICALKSNNGGNINLIVWDDGTADLGQSLCEGFLAAGWTEFPATTG